MAVPRKVRSVAVIGAGASGAVTADALRAEGVFDVIRVFERRPGVGGVWRYDPSPPNPPVPAGATQTELDPPLPIPAGPFPVRTPVSPQERWEETPNYSTLTTNVPALAMTYSDMGFDVDGDGTNAVKLYAVGKDTVKEEKEKEKKEEVKEEEVKKEEENEEEERKRREQTRRQFVHHSVVQRYIESYFDQHGTRGMLQCGVTVEDARKEDGVWRLVLRRRVREQEKEEKGEKKEGEGEGEVDEWWEERFDALVVAVGHYHVPYIPPVPGLREVQDKFPDLVEHSKFYRSPAPYANKKVLIIGNRASGTDVLRDVLPLATHPVFQSRRTEYAWRPPSPTENVVHKPPISHYDIIPSSVTGEPAVRVVFEDGSTEEGFDRIVYTTGYRYSYPFLKREIGDGLSTGSRITGTYLHTWWRGDTSLTFVGSVIDAVSFRAFEYQAIAVARFYAGRFSLPPAEEMEAWETARLQETGDTRAFHTIGWTGAREYWTELVQLAGGFRNGGGSAIVEESGGKGVVGNGVVGKDVVGSGRDFWEPPEEFWEELALWKDRVKDGWKEKYLNGPVAASAGQEGSRGEAEPEGDGVTNGVAENGKGKENGSTGNGAGENAKEEVKEELPKAEKRKSVLRRLWGLVKA